MCDLLKMKKIYILGINQRSRDHIKEKVTS